MKDHLTEHVRRAKISHDPNNTAWSRSSTTYGQKILQSHGWKPGSFLGARDTIRSVSPIIPSLPQVKIVLKDNNLGLGARGGANCVNEQRTGLDEFQEILRRLNGHSGLQLERQGNCCLDRMKPVHLASRIGAVRFVSGGFLGGTRQEEPVEEHMLEPIYASKGSLLKEDDVAQRAQTQLECEDRTPSHTEPSNPPTHKSFKKRRARDIPAVPNGSKFMREKHYNCTIPDDQGHQNNKSTAVIDPYPLDLHTAARRVDIEERKIKRMEREVEQALLVEKPNATVDVPTGIFQQTQSLNPLPPVTVLRSVPHTSQQLEGRRAIRQRYIKQMKMALTDSKALNEVRQVLKMRGVQFHRLTWCY